MPLCDAEVIDELRELMGADFPMLVRTFLDDAAVLRSALTTAIDRDDAQALRRSSHSLKGACLNLGASRMAQVCEQFETFGSAADCAAARQLLPAFDDAYAALRSELLTLH